MGLAGASVRSAFLPPEDAAALLREPLGVRPTVLDPWGGLAPVTTVRPPRPWRGAAAALLRGAAA